MPGAAQVHPQTLPPPPLHSPLPRYSLAVVRELELALERALAIVKREPQPAPNLVRHVGELLIGLDGPELPGETEVVFAAMRGAHDRAMVENATLRGDKEQLRAQLQRAQASTAAIPERLAGPPPPELEPLRSLVERVLQPMREQREQSAAATTEEDHATKLPAGLKDFTPLAKEPEIKEAAAGLHALELALVKAPSSETARSDLSAAVARLEEATSAKIKERAASLQDAQNLLHPGGFTCEKSGQSPIYGFRYHWDEKVPSEKRGQRTYPAYRKEHNLCEAEYEKLPELKDGSHPDTTCEKSGQSPIVGFRYTWKEAVFLKTYHWQDDYHRHHLCEAEYQKLTEDEKIYPMDCRFEEKRGKPKKYEKIPPPWTKEWFVRIAPPLCSKMLQDCEAAVADGNRDFSRIYKGVHSVIESGEGPGIARYETAVGVLREPVKGEPIKGEAAQREEAAEPTTLLADAALAKPAFDQVACSVAAATGAKLELQLLGDVDRHGREVTSLKKIARIVEKAQLRPGVGRGRTDRICDCVRCMLVAPSMPTVAAIAEALAALHREGVIEVVRLKDRFSSPSAGGWRDLMVNIVVLNGGAGGAVRHVCELQVCHEMMLTARKGLPGHEIYAIVRNAMEIIESCGLERELRREAVRKLRADGGSDADAIALSEDGWLITDAAWVRCFGDTAKLATKVKADEEGRVVSVELRSCKDMKELPASVGRLQALTKLDLVFCEGLTSLPAELGGLQALEALTLHGCSGLTSLPPELGGLQALKTLRLSQCSGLRSLPAELGRLQALEELNLESCWANGLGLTSLPAELGRLQALTKLNLVSCMSLTSLPDLSGLEKLRVEWGQAENLKAWVEGGRKALELPPPRELKSYEYYT